MYGKIIELIKLILGLILLFIPVLTGIIFCLESFKILNRSLNYANLSGIWRHGDTGASNTSIFLGLCGLAGAYLLANYKTNTQ
ncbi:hypothetical protein ESA94_19035 [Lacibacter luteus]|uniref:Uncharacterized protein n=1 Tax=Lacibacter luteus TaxID=2508719 RepID=A0A4Q1CEV5_9BACT|nr:hypothetical protein [Lacibacter luteus]RXK58107.1 hypothetical protein ESA94_19035 [Lacibacter luteus]